MPMIDRGMELFTKLKRYPHVHNSELRAWDAADELILNSDIDFSNKKILILNDSFGAIASALNEYRPTSFTDSFVASKAIARNAKFPNIINNLNQTKEIFDLVIIRLPKNLSFFEDTLIQLSKMITEDTQIVFASMIKHMANGHFDIINKIIGETTTSLAKKKARLIYAQKERATIESTYPKEIELPIWPNKIMNGSNLFSREKLDYGSKFLIENIPTGDYKKVLDLGCGNGIIGLSAKQLNPDSYIVFTDESYLSIECTKSNYKNNFQDEAEFHFTNCLEDYNKQDVDLILCNPPFHQGTTVGDFIAWQMFKDSFKVLKKGGKLRVIGNGHLGYHTKLEKIFKNSKIIAQNKKFVIIDAIKN